MATAKELCNLLDGCKGMSRFYSNDWFLKVTSKVYLGAKLISIRWYLNISFMYFSRGDLFLDEYAQCDVFVKLLEMGSHGSYNEWLQFYISNKSHYN